MIFLNLLLINLLSATAEQNPNNGYCDATTKTCEKPDVKLMLYDVNPQEGFNLRRDVYLRFAIMLSEALKSNKKGWHLVLPPWEKLYHWKTETPGSSPTFWNAFFDIKSLNSFVPVLDIYEAFEKNNKNPLQIDTLYILKDFENPFENGVFEEKWQITTDCEYDGYHWGYKNITAKEVVCVRFQGKISRLWELVAQHPSDKIVMFMHGQIPLHDNYGSKTYWDCRKSMKFNKKLVKAAKKFIEEKLETDKCKSTKCHSYLSFHWRRGDFVYSRPNDVPSIDGTVKQVDEAIKKHNLKLKKIFIATDALIADLKQLKSKLKDLGYKVYVYKPSESDMEEYKDGGIAIIDQIICSYATYFIGTHDSTFSFRIQEEREILGFDSNTTFNRFCPDSGPCEKPSKWTIVN